MDGSDVDYANWGIDEPDNMRVSEYSNEGQHYVAVHKLLRYWQDSDSKKKMAFLCQCPGFEDDDSGVFPTGLPEEEGVVEVAAVKATPAKGKRFVYYPMASSFWKAQSRCVNSGGNLACPSNARQNEFIANIIRSNSWLGVLDFNREGNFRCSSSEGLTYTNWGLNQPDNAVRPTAETL